MKISVVIPTLGRDVELRNTLRDLQSQSRPPDEIVVVDQNQPPLTNLGGVKHILNSTPGVVLNTQRAWKEATGDLILFLDDDVELDLNLVREHEACYLADSKLGGVAGRVEQPVGDLPPQKIYNVGTFDPWLGRVVGNFNAEAPFEVDYAPGGNASFRKEVLEEVGGLDLSFGGNGYFFEPDLGLRIRKAGYRIRFEPKATLRHLMAPRGGARVTDKALHTYYFLRHGIKLHKKHGYSLSLPLNILSSAAYCTGKALKNANLKIAYQGLRGIFDGLTH